MQAQGSLRETNLATLLQTMQAERATGTLSLADTEQCALYFLFGHLFHASGASGQGEDVVISALGWETGTFKFDPRAKLPAEETIKSPPADLISRAERRRRETPVSATVAERADEPSIAFRPEASRPAPEPARQLRAEEPEPYRREPSPPMDVAEPRWQAPEPEAEPALEADTPPAVAASQRAVAQPRQPEPIVATAAPEEETVTQQRSTSPQTTPTVERARSDEVGGAPDAPPLDSLYPLPAGKKQYEGLKSAFVDFPKLLRTLKSDGHTGYVRLNDDDYAGGLLLHDGDLLEALSSNGGISNGEAAFLQFRRHMDEGSGLIDVIELSSETVIALAQLLTARPLFTGLLGRFVDFNALLEYLAEESVDGSVVVTGGRETGVILLRDGAVLGAYTASARELDTKTNLVAALAKEAPARIEVKSGAVDVVRMDFEASLSQPY